MRVYKQWSIMMLGFLLLFASLLVGFNYVMDPLQFYRKAFYQPDFSTEQRYQNPGLARNYDYDTIVVGSSMTENFMPSYVNDKLGGKMLKLSMSGAAAKEQYLIAKVALETGKVKRVIWGIDYFSLRGDPDRVRDEYGVFPFYLYDRNPLNDAQYLVNFDTMWEAGRLALANAGIGEKVHTDLETLNTWGYYTFSAEKVMAEWNKSKGGGKVIGSEYEFGNIKRNIDENLVSLIKMHPDVEFMLYYPPYSILQHMFFYEKNKVLFDNELETKEYLFAQVGKMPHVRLFDFQQVQEITHELDNYKDLAHHSPEINEWMIDAMAVGRYRVTEGTLNTFLAQLRQQVEAFDLSRL